MDHHGILSNFEAVSIRAYRDCYGARKYNPRFVIGKPADEDATFAAASLAGILPERNPKILALAKTIAEIDTEPVIGLLKLPTLPEGYTSLAWRGNGRPSFTNADAIGGILFWEKLLENSAESRNIIASARKNQEKRDEKAKELMKRNSEKINNSLLFIDEAEPGLFGFHIWCGFKGWNINYSSAWKYPIVLCRYSNGIATIAAPSKIVAEQILGPGGLKNIFSRLPQKNGESWGGREAIGGGPRSGGLTREDCIFAAKQIISYLKR